ncbi:hypothetical protein AMAG_18927 [Allomyces macrogynus ATCC 38327]|uniref:Uncharacterized protein n=1 Tax=Allomyces macrogynus (strain ATCC 38327) TaxID=578462 RepID=A0A0L0SK36_ALLM3|nr:hypothetical protein AMAG_18927 [Allomyces macrogynus ATCC 38327]|eukprot:KNE62851.1 hypothetical protein AMAG_18927 [Allomyces macrogynus ATCC 38327]
MRPADDPDAQVYKRYWMAVYGETNPGLAEDYGLHALVDECGKWTTTRDMDLFVNTHRAVCRAVLADPGAEIPDKARPTERDWAVFDMVLEIFEAVDQAPIRDGVAPMLAKLRGAETMVMTRHVYHALYIDPASNGGPTLARFLGTQAAEIEGTPCPPEVFQARWKRLRDEHVPDLSLRIAKSCTSSF